jgi:hypothetical protein
VLTSRERPRVVEQIEDDLPVVRVLALEGLAVNAGQSLLQARGLGAEADLTATVVRRYSGNPLALKLVARTIEELFDRDIAAFLSDESLIFDDIRTVLDQQFARLSPLEREILVWMAIEREAITVPVLAQNLVQAPSRRALVEALQALQRRSLLEKIETGFTLQNVVTEYLTDFLVEQVCRELEASTLPNANGESPILAPHHSQAILLSALNRFALLKAQAKEAVRQSQVRLILQPIANRLITKMGKRALVEMLQHRLGLVQAAAHSRAADAPGYAGGNILNLLLHLGVDIAGYDFSNICVWQAYLRGVYAPRLNLTGADLKGTAFTHSFGWINGLLFRADGELVIFGSSHGMACIWRATDGGLLHTFPLQAPENNRFHLHHHGRIGVLGGANHALNVVDFAEERLLCTFATHQNSVWRVVFSLNGNLVASGDASGQVCVWEAESGHLVQRWCGHAAPVSALAFAPAGDLVASADVDGVLCLCICARVNCFIPGKPIQRKWRRSTLRWTAYSWLQAATITPSASGMCARQRGSLRMARPINACTAIRSQSGTSPVIPAGGSWSQGALINLRCSGICRPGKRAHSWPITMRRFCTWPSASMAGWWPPAI